MSIYQSSNIEETPLCTEGLQARVEMPRCIFSRSLPHAAYVKGHFSVGEFSHQGGSVSLVKTQKEPWVTKDEVIDVQVSVTRGEAAEVWTSCESRALKLLSTID